MKTGEFLTNGITYQYKITPFTGKYMDDSDDFYFKDSSGNEAATFINKGATEKEIEEKVIEVSKLRKWIK